MKKHIPNTITCLNLFSGCVGIVYAFDGQLHLASYAIILSAVFDFFDGMVARILKAYSEIGKELDSLADVVSFGVLPSVIVYKLFINSPQIESLGSNINFSAFLIAIFSALRLAKFNVDTRQAEHFIGLPTPANALFIASLPMIVSQQTSFLAPYILNPFFLGAISIVMSLLLVAELSLISLKFKNLALAPNLFRYVLLVSSLVLLLAFNFTAVPFILALYIILSIIHFKFVKASV